MKNIKPWQVVSLLMRYKIIKKRDEALGYDKYKDTEEYKSKLEKQKTIYGVYLGTQNYGFAKLGPFPTVPKYSVDFDVV